MSDYSDGYQTPIATTSLGEPDFQSESLSLYVEDERLFSSLLPNQGLESPHNHKTKSLQSSSFSTGCKTAQGMWVNHRGDYTDIET